MQRKQIWCGAATLLAAAVFATGSSAGVITTTKAGGNLIQNGGFENGLTDWTPSDFTFEGFDYGVDGQAHTGNAAFYGGGIGAPGFLSQTITTVPGVDYVVDAWLMSDGFLPNLFTVATDGTVRLTLSDILIGPYVHIGAGFRAVGATSTLQFGLRNDSGFLHLDDVRVVAAAPEPPMLTLLGLGLAGIVACGGLANRKRQPGA
jgi:hypothetical protein